MNPNDVNKLLESLTTEFVLPVTVFNCGPLLISEDDSKVPREHLEDIAQQWMNLDRSNNDEIPQEMQECIALLKEEVGLHRNHRNHRISVRKTVADIYDEVEYLASDTQRVPEVRDILKSLITERSLPCDIFYRGFDVVILPEDPTRYRDKEMAELGTLLEKENLEVQVRHSGFNLERIENGSPDIQFSQLQELTSRLQASLEKHGLKTHLLHNGFKLEKNQEDEVHIAEAKELAIRLKFMTGIDYVSVGGYGMGPENDVKPGWTKKINWNSITFFTRGPY
jgi:hypothetical protein